MIEPAIFANGLEKRYLRGDDETHILRGVDFRAEPGEFVLAMGPSGSGKSTLLAVLSGLLRPDAGLVRALGTDLWRLTDDERDLFRLRYCGFIFQGFHLFPALTAIEQVALVLTYQGKSRDDAVVIAKAALAEVGLESQLYKRPASMSGGERQRVAIARAIAKEPKLIFADEPTSALDSVNGQIVTRLLQRAAKNHGAAVMCVTHDHRLEPFADRIVQLEDGQILIPSGKLAV